MAARLSRRPAGEVRQSLLRARDARCLPAASRALGYSGCLAEAPGVARSVRHGFRVEARPLRPELHSGTGTALARHVGEPEIVAHPRGLERRIRYFPKKDRLPVPPPPPGISQNRCGRIDDAHPYVVAEFRSGSCIHELPVSRLVEFSEC